MYNIARLNDEDRNTIFSNYVFKYGSNIAIVEKDFWVCLVLDYLFHKSNIKTILYSKAVHLYQNVLILLIDFRKILI